METFDGIRYNKTFDRQDATKEKRGFLVVNFTNDDSPYMNSNFEPIFIEEK